MKNLCWQMVLAVCVWGCCAGTQMAAAQDDAVLLAVPSRVPVVQVAFDVARRYPTVLVSYQGTDPGTVLHVWNGFEWRPLAGTDYQSGAFLQAFPRRALFVGGDELLPASVKDISSWCAETTQVTDLERAELINAIGKYLPFTPADWRWFAGRYNLSLTNLKAEEAARAQEETWYAGKGPVKDEAPGFFKYFTRSRRGARGAHSAEKITPVEVDAADVVDVPAAP